MKNITDEQEKRSFQAHPVFDLSACSPASLCQFWKHNKIKTKTQPLKKSVIPHLKKIRKWSIHRLQVLQISYRW